MKEAFLNTLTSPKKTGIAAGLFFVFLLVSILIPSSLTLAGFAIRDLLKLGVVGIVCLLFVVLFFFKDKKLQPPSLKRVVFAGLFAASFYASLYGTVIPLWVCYLVLFVGGYVFFTSIENFQDYLTQRSQESNKKVFWICWGVFFCCLLLVWSQYFPYGVSPDTDGQWSMLHGITAFRDTMPVGYVIYLQLLLSIVDSYTFVVFVQLVLASLLGAVFSNYLYKKGCPIFLVLLVPMFMFTLASVNTYAFPWKDVPFTLCVGVLVYTIFQNQEKDSTLSLGSCIVLGIACAFTTLFRSNGIVITGIILIYFLVSFLRRKLLKQALLVGLSCALCFGGSYYYQNQVIRPIPSSGGWLTLVFVSGISAAVVEGNVTEEQLSEIGSLYSLSHMRENYNLEEKLSLIGAGLCLDGNEGAACAATSTPETIRLYFSLLPSNIGPMVKDVIYNAKLVLSTSYLFYEYNAFYILLLLFTLCCLKKKENRKKAVVPLLPILLNGVTIALATLSWEPRYLLSTYFLFAPLLGYFTIMKMEENS